jgi:hypothetical protein
MLLLAQLPPLAAARLRACPPADAGAVSSAAGLQVDRVIVEGNRDGTTGEPIPSAEPGTADSYLYLDV